MINSDFADIELQQMWIKELGSIECEPFFFYDTKGTCYMHELSPEYQKLYEEKNIKKLRDIQYKVRRESLRLKFKLTQFVHDMFSKDTEVFFRMYSREFEIYDYKTGNMKKCNSYVDAMDLFITLHLDDLTLEKAIKELEEGCNEQNG